LCYQESLCAIYCASQGLRDENAGDAIDASGNVAGDYIVLGGQNAMKKTAQFRAEKYLLSITGNGKEHVRSLPSVTKRRGRAKRIRPRQVRGVNAPHRLGRIIEPWLTLANYWPELQKRNPDSVAQLVEFAMNTPETPEFPGYMLKVLIRDPGAGAPFLARLAGQVHQVFSFWTEGTEYGTAGVVIEGVAFLARTGDDSPTIARHVPVDVLLDVIKRIPPARLGQCAVCGRFFYRKRSGKFGTKDCSEACANRRRVAKSREKKDRNKYKSYLRAEGKKQ
jgi:hypothetical protein